jgi:hypothetical protein
LFGVDWGISDYTKIDECGDGDGHEEVDPVCVAPGPLAAAGPNVRGWVTSRWLVLASCSPRGSLNALPVEPAQQVPSSANEQQVIGTSERATWRSCKRIGTGLLDRSAKVSIVNCPENDQQGREGPRLPCPRLPLCQRTDPSPQAKVCCSLSVPILSFSCYDQNTRASRGDWALNVWSMPGGLSPRFIWDS